MLLKSPTIKALPAALAIAGTALLALPVSGVAAEKFGSRFANSPNSGACSGLMSTPCTYVSFIHPAEGTGDPYSGGAPNDGVITKFQISANGAGASVTFRLADITRDNQDSAQARTVATGPTVTIAGTGAIEEFPARVPVKRGNHLAIDTSAAEAVYASSGSKFTYVYAPPLVDGAALQTSNAVTEELLVAAIYEPDADGDGYGDETQDQCLNNPSDAQAPCTTPTVPDQAKPRVTGVSLTKTSFKGSAKLLYRLSERAKLTVKVERIAKGRRVAGKCKRQTAANRMRRSCKRYVKVGTIRANGVKGLNQVKVPGRLGGRKLAPGAYRLVITARDSAGNVSAAKRIGFRIKR